MRVQELIFSFVRQSIDGLCQAVKRYLGQRAQPGIQDLLLSPVLHSQYWVQPDAALRWHRQLLRRGCDTYAIIYGGVSKNGQVEALRRGAEIVVACPGRLLDLASDRSIDLSRVEVLVLDKADRMCDMSFLPDIRRILKLVPVQRQTLFFSATMPEVIRELADRILKNPVTVQVGVIAPAKTVSHTLYPVSQDLKKQLLLATLEQTATDRARKTGEAFTFMAQSDEPFVREIEKVLGKRIERRRLPGFNYRSR